VNPEPTNKLTLFSTLAIVIVYLLTFIYPEFSKMLGERNQQEQKRLEYVEKNRNQLDADFNLLQNEIKAIPPTITDNNFVRLTAQVMKFQDQYNFGSDKTSPLYTELNQRLINTRTIEINKKRKIHGAMPLQSEEYLAFGDIAGLHNEAQRVLGYSLLDGNVIPVIFGWLGEKYLLFLPCGAILLLLNIFRMEKKQFAYGYRYLPLFILLGPYVSKFLKIDFAEGNRRRLAQKLGICWWNMTSEETRILNQIMLQPIVHLDKRLSQGRIALVMSSLIPLLSFFTGSLAQAKNASKKNKKSDTEQIDSTKATTVQIELPTAKGFILLQYTKDKFTVGNAVGTISSKIDEFVGTLEYSLPTGSIRRVQVAYQIPKTDITLTGGKIYSQYIAMLPPPPITPFIISPRTYNAVTFFDVGISGSYLHNDWEVSLSAIDKSRYAARLSKTWTELSGHIVFDYTPEQYKIGANTVWSNNMLELRNITISTINQRTGHEIVSSTEFGIKPTSWSYLYGLLDSKNGSHSAYSIGAMLTPNPHLRIMCQYLLPEKTILGQMAFKF